MEPELGLGIVIEVGDRKITIHFPASECTRQYAIESAPLQRVRFQVGDSVKGQRGEHFCVRHVVENEGLITYVGDDIDLLEPHLSDSISFTTPQSRLLNGLGDTNAEFNLRYETLINQWEHRKSKTRGFMGGRIDLIPHQIYIAGEVTSRYIPRVLLADEVGLGKTIEACLILHRLLVNEKISRVLILVPPSLVHQWFVELLRRFHLVFRILDESYCQSLEGTQTNINPFQEEQWVLCDIDFLSQSEKRKQQAIDGQWDMLVVDEVHHLTEENPDYQFVQALGEKTQGMLLLTATPEQLGQRSHFARLRLLDPARYHDFRAFQEEAEQYHRTARIADTLLNGLPLEHNDEQFLSEFLSERESRGETPKETQVRDNEVQRQEVIDELLDRYGPGRVMFRNTRSSIPGFPDRVAKRIELRGSNEHIKRFEEEFRADYGDSVEMDPYDLMKDPRMDWLADLLQQEKDRKILLICQSPFKVKAIDEALRVRVKVKAGLFHEELSLIQRDRNAAWFAEKDGAQILICSEIGSEGRNFQFAHHMVLFDLPLDPEKLEQRIGRLDRIGQTQTIFIYIPYVSGTPQEVLIRWYHEGLNAFERNVPGVYQIYNQMGGRVKDIALRHARSKDTTSVERLLEETQSIRDRYAEYMKQGRDRLLELNSFKPKVANDLIHRMVEIDNDRALDEYMARLFHHFGIETEAMGGRTHRLDFNLLTDPEFPIPPMRDEHVEVTFDRKKALNREDMDFLTWDHPMVRGSLELILGSEKGNSCFALWPESHVQEILLETIFVLECVAPIALQADRFMPATPVRVVVNHHLGECTEAYPFEVLSKSLKENFPFRLLNNTEFTQTLLPKILDRAREIAETHVAKIIYTCLEEMHTTLGKEIRRLEILKKVNPNVREEEISLIKEEKDSLHDYIAKARIRLDALRLIWKGSTDLSTQM